MILMFLEAECGRYPINGASKFLMGFAKIALELGLGYP